MKNFRFACLVTSLVLTSCAIVPRHQATPETVELSAEATQEIRMRLFAVYGQWSGVRYQAGGLGKQGIDCSGLVHLTFQQHFQIHVPRTTEQLAQHGTPVSLEHLLPGDLVFFKTGPFERHVGIYYGDRKFIHASLSKGVTLSSLTADYWEDRVWQARRILSEHHHNL